MSVELLRSWIQLYAKPLWCSNAQTSLLGPTQYAKKKKMVGAEGRGQEGYAI